jgi:hypothetical protein
MRMIRVSRLLIPSRLSNSGSTEAEHFIHPLDYGCIHAAAARTAVSAGDESSSRIGHDDILAD